MAQNTAPADAGKGNGATNQSAAMRVADEQVQVLGRGFHHNVIQYTRKVQETNGIWREISSRYTQLENGLNGKDAQGNWVPVSAVLEVTADGAQCIGAEWTAQFRTTPGAADAVILTTGYGSETKRYVSHVVGLAYFDKQSGDSVLLSGIADNPPPGMLTSGHELVYPGCFTDVDCDLVYHVTRSSFSQDLRLKSSLPSPAVYQLNPDTTELEVLTEFVEADAPRISAAAGIAQPGPADDLGDADLKFSLFEIGLGRAFVDPSGTNSPADAPSEPVRKRWTQLSGRQVLIEALDYPKASGWLGTLPAAKGGASLKVRPTLRREAKNRPLPLRPKRFDQAGQGSGKGIRKVLAWKDAPAAGPALVLDYQSLVGSQPANFTFAANETYYISSSASLSGTVTFEGNCVLKYGTNASLSLGSGGVVVCQTGLFRPIIMTAVDDAAVGAGIANANLGVTGGYYAYPALSFDAGSSINGLNLSCFQVRYARLGFSLRGNGSSGSGHTLRHGQFTSCNVPVFLDTSTKLAVRNALFYGIGSKVFDLSSGAVVDAQHMTADSAPTLVSGGTLKLTNSLLSGITTYASGTTFTPGTGNVFTNTGGYAAGASGYVVHYLNASTFQDKGTTNIEAALLADLRLRTTQPPTYVDLTTGSLPSPVARDTGNPDAGYHYDPVDGFADSVTVSDGHSLSLPAGYVLALLTSSGALYPALTVQSGGLTTAAGPGNRAWIVRHELIAEADESTISGDGAKSIVFGTGSGAASLSLRFCNFAGFGGCGSLEIGNYPTNLALGDCEFYGGQLNDSGDPSRYGGAASRIDALRNNLFMRTVVTLAPTNTTGVTVTAQNNTFVGSTLTLWPSVADQWVFRNNLFDRCGITAGPLEFVASNNGYVTNSTATSYLNGGSLSDVILSAAPYVAGTLGNFYLNQSSGLVDAGDGTADAEGFFFDTTSTVAQSMEGQTRIDIGYHYPALDGTGQLYTSGGGPGVVNDPTGATYLKTQAYGQGNGPTQGYSVFITKPVNGQNHP